ncbi:MAG TPA: hypothetical protein VGJ66_18010 [Pyrinomonadaceae bacterium]|jgi:hypothetical protein
MSANEPLELRDFVAETIKQVIDGVVTAQQYATSKKAVVNPRTSRHGEPVQSIAFDVAVTAGKGAKTQGGIAVFTGVLGLGSKGQSEKTSESVNRIQFSVPLALPVGTPWPG